MFKNHFVYLLRQFSIILILPLALLVASLIGSSGSYAMPSNSPVPPPGNPRGVQPPPQGKPRGPREGTLWDAYVKANEQVQQMRAAQSPGRSQIAGITPNSWTWLGPGNVGGRIRSILPINATTIFIGSAGGGIWKTTDAALTWSPVNDLMANLSIGPLVLDPINSNTIYAGTGGDWSPGDEIRGAGIFSSTDGGSTWNQILSTNTPDFYNVNGLAISSDGTTLLAGTNSGVWRSPTGGTGWTSVYTVSGVLQVLFDPTDNTKAIAATPNGALYSNDSGQTWHNDTTLPGGTTELAYAPSSPNIVYASVDHNNGEVWRSTNWGHSYSLVNTGNNFFTTGGNDQGWYDNVVWVDPTDPTRILVGGEDLWKGTYNAGISRVIMTDIGGYSGSIHADQHAIVAATGFNNSTNPRVLIGNDGGIFTTPDIFTVNPTSGWVNLNNFLGITQLYSAAGNATTGVVIMGSQDNGSWRFNGQPDFWSYINGTPGDDMVTAADQADPNYFYTEGISLTIHRSKDGGSTMSDISAGLADANKCAKWSAPFILDPNNDNTLLAGGCSLWRSTNVKAITPPWISIKSSTGSLISAIAVAHGNSDIMWVGYDSGEIDMTTNGTNASPRWTRVDTNTITMPQSGVTSLAIDPDNANIVYATYGTFDSNNVWLTNDGGSHWYQRVGLDVHQLPPIPVYSLAIHPKHPAWIYVGTDIGIFASEDDGYTWDVPQGGPANVSTYELQWMGNTLLAATHGRGAFSVTINPPNPLPAGEVIAADAAMRHIPVFTASAPIVQLNSSAAFLPMIVR